MNDFATFFFVGWSFLAFVFALAYLLLTAVENDWRGWWRDRRTARAIRRLNRLRG
jgi:hypothetical protein